MQYIFIHGLGQTPSSWDNTISSISKPIKSNCPDLSALLSGKKVVYSNMYAAFSKYCDNFAEPLCLCGLSLGGILALNYAIDNPEKIQLLILIGTQYKMPKTLLKLQNAVFHIMPKSAFTGMGLCKNDVIGLTNSMLDLDFSDGIKNITCQTLILCGVNDKANKNAAEDLSKTIVGAKLKMIENASHEVNKDNPQKLALEISESFR